MVKILAIGDLHIKACKTPFIQEFQAKLLQLVDATKPDFVVFLGDILHRTSDHCAVKCAEVLFDAIRQRIQTFVLVGNHDMYDKQFLTEEHWMVRLKNRDRLTIVDKPVWHSNVVLCPYVETGRFLEALDTCGEWRKAQLIFAHQEFRGAAMRGGISICGDEWHEDAPYVVSGHIHGRQELGRVIYTGSVEQERTSYIAQIQLETARPPQIHYTPLSASGADVGRQSREVPKDFVELYRRKIFEEGDAFIYCAAERALTGVEMDEDDYLFIRVN